METLGSGVTGVDVFEELRFVWEYLAAAALLLSAQAEARPHGAARGAAVLAVFSLLSLGYFPLKDVLMAAGAPRMSFVCWYLGLQFAMTFSLLWVFRVSVPDLLWTSATAYVEQHMVYVLVHEALALWLWPSLTESFLLYVLLSVGCCAVIYGIMYRLLAGPLRMGAGSLLGETPHTALAQATILAMLFLSTFGFQHLFQLDESRPSAIWMDLLVCAMLLVIQYTSYRSIALARERHETERLLDEAATHWELSHALIERLGGFMHDVWHVALGVRVAKVPGMQGYIDRVERDLDDYRSTFRSSNEVLNSVLAGASLLCGHRGIDLSCSMGRVDVSGIPAADLYALVNGLVRISLDAATKLPDAGHRAINLGFGQRAGMLIVTCDVACEEGSDPWDSVEGLRSLSALAQRGGGTLQVMARDGVATAQAVLPQSR